MNQEKFLQLKAQCNQLRQLAESELLNPKEREVLARVFLSVKKRAWKIESAKLAGRRRKLWLEGKQRTSSNFDHLEPTFSANRSYLQYRRYYNIQAAKKNDLPRATLLRSHSLDVARAFPKSKLPA